MNVINWIENWFAYKCNGDWEHENGIEIVSVSNPGWYITIDLRNTPLENLQIDNDTIEHSENDWYFYIVKDAKYLASGDTTKLEFLLEKFKELVEQNSKIKE